MLSFCFQILVLPEISTKVTTTEREEEVWHSRVFKHECKSSLTENECGKDFPACYLKTIQECTHYNIGAA